MNTKVAYEWRGVPCVQGTPIRSALFLLPTLEQTHISVPCGEEVRGVTPKARVSASSGPRRREERGRKKSWDRMSEAGTETYMMSKRGHGWEKRGSAKETVSDELKRASFCHTVMAFFSSISSNPSCHLSSSLLLVWRLYFQLQPLFILSRCVI